MVKANVLAPSAELRDELCRRGGVSAQRCFQCATCSAVCSLAPDGQPFPRLQMLKALLGLIDSLAADPAVWLCHNCNDCTVRCPRDARPGDVLQAVRSIVIERLAMPRWFGSVVAHARATWPLLIGVPLAFWVVLLGVTGHLTMPDRVTHYGQIVPHVLIYSVFIPVSLWVVFAAWMSGRRFWHLLGSAGPPRRGSWIASTLSSLGEIANHRRFAQCDAAHPRRWAHLLLMWGFIGAAVTSGLLVIALYGFQMQMPLPLDHPFKILGNLSAICLLAGGTMLSLQRIKGGDAVGQTTAFDSFFLSIIVWVIVSGTLVELGRFFFPGEIAGWLYIVHLAGVLTLFMTFPYSKFAHMMYRTLAMIHQKMTEEG